MIIEDKEDILILYRDFLWGKRHDVTTSYQRSDIIKRFLEEKYDVFLIDYRLPGTKNGIDIAIEILDISLTPIIFITAYENLQKEISKIPIFHGKNVEVLLKPVNLDKIESTMVNLVNK